MNADEDPDEVPTQYDPSAVEPRVAEYWEEVDAYEAAKQAHRDDPDFFFVDGPPYTSGQMHLGTAWNKTLKDAILRQKRMAGHDVYDRPGYDMHGLPIEVKVEEELGFDSKKDIEAFGVEAFIDECKQFALENRRKMDDDFQSIGAWMDWDDPYQTITPEYMEAAWWAFQRVAERGLVERGKRAVNQCPRCETAIANNEVERHDVHKPAIHVRLPLAEREGSLVVWTTTPWTLPANTFVAVDGDAEYVGVDADRDGETYRLYVSKAGLEETLRAGRYEDYEVAEELDGSELTGWRYDYPLDEQVPEHVTGEGVHAVYEADYADATDKTGLVHSAPGHGEEDFERGQELGLPAFSPVGGDGRFTEAGGAYAGQFVRDANDDVIADLESAGLLLAHDPNHLVEGEGQCWRCDTDIVRIVTDQWFITVTDIKEDLLDRVEDSEWHPAWARDNRFRNFVADAPDWNVSRQRYWGIPLPIWKPQGVEAYETEDCLVVGTRAELAERVDQDVDPAELDLHRPGVDPLTITEEGTTYERVPDVFDVWIDSSVATWATLDYPGSVETDAGESGSTPNGSEAFEELWPADLVVEAHDQTRGWFWSQLGMGTAALDQVPYEEVVMHGFANDSEGRKMSKSLGNIVTPQEAIEKYGRDPLRTYLLRHDQHGADLAFDWDGLEETQSDLNVLWNVFRFPLSYMALDDYDPATPDLDDCELATVDEWVLSRLQTVEAEAREAWADYAVHDALSAVLEFVVEDVSRFYVKATRERMWAETESPEKRAAYATLATVLDEVTRLLAPVAPYLAERMYRRLDGAATTVHALSYPEPDDRLRDDGLEARMATLRAVEEAAATARQQAGRKLRWPVRRVVVESDDPETRGEVEALSELLADRTNARTVSVVASFDELVAYADPEMSAVGPALGDAAQDVMTAVEGRRLADLRDEDGGLSVTVDGETYELTDEMVAVRTEPPEDVSAAEFSGGTVYVDAGLTAELESEGYARDVVRRVQEMRKRLDLDVEAEIEVAIDVADDRVAAFVDDHREYIATETRTSAFVARDDREFDLVEEWEIEGVDVTIAVARAEPAEQPA